MKYLSLLLIVILFLGCERASNENTPKPPFTNIDQCIDYLNKSDAKKAIQKGRKNKLLENAGITLIL